MIFEIGDGSCDAEDAVERARTHGESIHGHFKELLAGGIGRAQFAKKSWSKLSVAVNATKTGEARALDFSSLEDTRSNSRGGLPFIRSRQVLVGNPGDIDVEVEPVE